MLHSVHSFCLVLIKGHVFLDNCPCDINTVKRLVLCGLGELHKEPSHLLESIHQESLERFIIYSADKPDRDADICFQQLLTNKTTNSMLRLRYYCASLVSEHIFRASSRGR